MRLWSPSSSDRSLARAPARIAREALPGSVSQSVSRGDPNETTLDRALRLGWRYRRELAPLWALGGLLVVSVAGHEAAQPYWWAAAIVAIAGTAGLALRMDRQIERAYVGAVAGSAAIWSCVVWGFGPNPLLLWALVLAAPAAILWWRHQHVRSRIEMVTDWPRYPSEMLTEWRFRWGVRRELARVMADWPRTAANATVPGSTIRRAVADRKAYTLHVDLRPGQTHREMLNHRAEIGSALRAHRGTVRIEPEERMDRIRIRWVHDDPLTAPIISWRPLAADAEERAGEVVDSIAEPVELGLYEHGEPVRHRLADGAHVLICGIIRHGKSSIANVIVGSLAGARDAVIWVVDPKGGVEFAPWGPVVDRLTDRRGALAMFGAVERVIEARESILRAAGLKEWNAKLGPYLVLIIDEFPRLPQPAQDAATGLAQLGAFVGLRLVVIAQSPSAAALGGSTDLRDNLLVVISTLLKGSDAARQAFGAGAQDGGWDPSKLPARGYFLIKGAGLDEPIPARAYFPDPTTVREVGARFGGSRPALDAASAAAAALVERDVDGPPRPRVLEAEEAPWSETEDEGVAARLAKARLPILARAIRMAPRPVSGREAARRADLPNDWVRRVGLAALEAEGAIEQLDSGEWRAIEAAEVQGGEGE